MPRRNSFASDTEAEMSDERRTEIEALAAAIDQCRPRNAAWREWLQQVAEEAIAALDRVRDTRGVDEAVTCECGKVCDSERHQRGHAVLSLQPDKHRLVAARSPQGED